jgi:DNA-binding protein YbaB
MTMPPGFEDLHRLRGEAERMTRVLGAAQDPDATFEGHDETEAVTATVDMDGVVTDVSLEREWYATVDHRRLGAAVVEAVNAAGIARLSGWAEKVAEAEENEPAATPSAPPLPSSMDINPSGAMIDHLLYLLHRVGKESESESKAAAAAAMADEPVTGESAGGHIMVVLAGKQVAEVQVEFRWVGTANHREIQSELRTAFASAYRNLAESTPVRRPDSAIAELQAMTADPQEFIANLFGVRQARP